MQEEGMYRRCLWHQSLNLNLSPGLLTNEWNIVIEIDGSEPQTDTVTNANSTSNLTTNSNASVAEVGSPSPSTSSSGSLPNKNKRKAKKEDLRKPAKIIKKDNKRIPNIAEELAKNRNQVKGTSPSPVHILSSTPVLPQQSQSPTIDSKMVNTNGSTEKSESVSRNETPSKTDQIKISSLLSPKEEIGTSSRASSQPLPLEPSDQPANPTQQGAACPKVILPTQKPGSIALEGSGSSDSTKVLVARMSSPVNMPDKLTSSLKKSHSTAGTTSTPIPAEKNTISDPNTKPSSEKAKKSHSVSSILAKSKSSKPNHEPKRKSNLKTVKKESLTHTQAITSSATEKPHAASSDKKEPPKKPSPKLPTVKKENSTSSNAGKTAEIKKKTSVKKESAPAPKPKTPKKLAVAPQIKSPSLLEVFERGKPTKEEEEPVVIIDVPLYSTTNNEYLDENGQVVFNYYKLVHDKVSSQNNANPLDEKTAKRNLLGQLNTSNSQIESIEDNEDEDIAEDDDDGEEDEDEEVDEEKTSMSPKKRPHPNKGKSLIGKYDTEDPFIDDSEMLWEEQRAATKDGFFVYFGPLIEKGHYASLERADGTMKRGGVKNK